jgi:hypothetical protein
MRSPHHDAITLVMKRPSINIMVNEDDIVAQAEASTFSSRKYLIKYLFYRRSSRMLLI